jgi:hypothetical protein
MTVKSLMVHDEACAKACIDLSARLSTADVGQRRSRTIARRGVGLPYEFT